MLRTTDPDIALRTVPVTTGTVSVILVVFMTGESLFPSVESALAQPEVTEVIVVDNGSLPEDAARLAELAALNPRVRLISGQGNVGFARGANLGARIAEGDLLVFLNPDAFLGAGGISALAEALEGRPSPSLAGARILNSDGTEQRGGRRGEISPLSTLLSLSGLTRLPALQRFEVHLEDQPTPAGVVAAPTVSGACFAMRRGDFESLGGFDSGYFLHVEDIDLCWRVRQAGGQVVFQPAARVIHVGHTSRAHPLRVEFSKGRGLARFFMKRARTPVESLAIRVLSPFIVAAAVVRPILWRIGAWMPSGRSEAAPAPSGSGRPGLYRAGFRRAGGRARHG
ncbi:MAG: glycosyltransferase family 2 protein [Phenylobacterium sp.]